MLAGFKKFIMRGNVLDLAVALVMGAAFGAVLTSLVNDMIMPLVTALFGKPSYDTLLFTVNGSEFHYGKLLTAAVNFLLVAAAVYFCLVLPMNALLERRKQNVESSEEMTKTPTETELLAEIRDLLKEREEARV